jgi:hypothetical protein
MVPNIAAQILNTPSSPSAPITATTESEATTQSPSETKPELNNFDERFGVLTKMERKIKELEAQNKTKAKEWEERQGKYSEYEELMKLADENPLEFLKKRKGWGVQEFNEFAVQHASDEDLDPVAKITKTFQDRIAELEKSWEEKLNSKIKEKEEELAGKDYERQIVEFKAGIKTFLAENKDAYEFIHAEEGGHDAVYDLIYQDIMRQKEAEVPDDQIKIMDVKDAAEKVESFLDTQYSKYLSLNKVKSKFNPGNESILGALKAKSESPGTLNSSFSPKSKSVAELSEEERRQAAIELIRSQRNHS